MDIVERNKKICQMYQSGLVLREIADQTGLSMTQIGRICREHNTQRPKYELDKEYFDVNKHKTARQISDETGLTYKRICFLRKIANGGKLTRGRVDFTDCVSSVDPTFIDNKEWLEEQYIHQNLGAPSIAKQLAMKCSDVYRALKKFHIKRRTTKTMMVHKRKWPCAAED